MLRNINPLTGKPSLGEIPRLTTVDREESRRSIRELAQVRPAIICFGHGHVLRDREEFERFVARMHF